MLGGFNQNRIIGIFQEFRYDKMNGIGGRGGWGWGEISEGSRLVSLLELPGVCMG